MKPEAGSEKTAVFSRVLNEHIMKLHAKDFYQKRI